MCFDISNLLITGRLDLRAIISTPISLSLMKVRIWVSDYKYMWGFKIRIVFWLKFIETNEMYFSDALDCTMQKVLMVCCPEKKD